MTLQDTYHDLQKIKADKQRVSDSQNQINDIIMYKTNHANNIFNIVRELTVSILTAICLILNVHRGLNIYGFFSKVIGLLNAVFDTAIFLIVLFVVFFIAKKIVIMFVGTGISTSPLDREKQEKITAAQKIISDSENEIRELAQLLDESPVSQKYRTLECVGWMLEAQKNKRGNTLTELINLYENELKHRDVVQTLQNNIRLQNQITADMQAHVANAEYTANKARKEANAARAEARSAQIRSWFKG